MPRRQGFIVWLFTPGSFLKIKQLAQFFGILFSTEQVVKILILAKNGLGYILGSFFTYSSGQPVFYNPFACFQTLKTSLSLFLFLKIQYPMS
jgi:hypothetical protein